MDTQTAQSLQQLQKKLCCPKCTGRLDLEPAHVVCTDCRQDYPSVNNIPLLFWPNEWGSTKDDVTEVVKAFYEETPFPNYDDFDNVGSLVHKARQGIVARLLDEQLPFGSSILECGCGTGQLSNFLSVANRTVVATDMCLNSLSLGQAFKEKNKLKRVHFVQMNLFRPIFQPESFDFVICNGVLHHTADPFLGYKTLARLVKPKGYILIGLYHTYARLPNDLRRFIFRLTGERFQFLDPRLRQLQHREMKRRAWFSDQYQHPHESKHTIEEIQGWFKQTGFSFVKSLPKLGFAAVFDENEPLFRPEHPGHRFERLLGELMMMFTNSHEGGFFLAIGQKRA